MQFKERDEIYKQTVSSCGGAEGGRVITAIEVAKYTEGAQGAEAARGGSAKEKKQLSLFPFKTGSKVVRGRMRNAIERSQSDRAKLAKRTVRTAMGHRTDMTTPK